MDSSDLECGVCNNLFSDDYCPMNLPCSHTFCGACIDSIISTQRKNCPICRGSFIATSAKDLMINRIALNVAKRLSSVQPGAKKISLLSPQMPPRGSLEAVTNDFKKETIKTALEDSQATESQIVGFLGILEEMIEGIIKVDKDIDRIMKELQKVKPLVKSYLTQTRSKVKEWTDHLSLVKEEKEDILDFETKLQNSDYSSAGLFLDEAAEVFQGSQEKFKEFKLLLQRNEKERQELEKEFLATEVELRRVLEEAARTFKASPQSNIMVDSLMEKSSRRAFLDLSLGDTPLGRIIIKVIDEGNIALNFLHMCAGDLGPSYANSRVSDVWNKGRDGEFIRMGKHTVKGVTSMKAVLSGLDWEREREIYEETPHKAGQVLGYFSADSASMFDIITRDHPRRRDRRCFGMVEERLHVLRDATSRYPHQDLRRIRITDCGLIYSP